MSALSGADSGEGPAGSAAFLVLDWGDVSLGVKVKIEKRENEKKDKPSILIFFGSYLSAPVNRLGVLALHLWHGLAVSWVWAGHWLHEILVGELGLAQVGELVHLNGESLFAAEVSDVVSDDKVTVLGPGGESALLEPGLVGLAVLQLPLSELLTERSG